MTPQELNQVYQFVEPHYTGGVCHIRISAKKAIQYIDKYLRETYKPPIIYEGDRRLLEEFVAMNWAYPLEGVFEEDDTRTT